MTAESDNTDYDKLFPRCIGCDNHGRQHRGGTKCWQCSRYHPDLFTTDTVERLNPKTSQG
jgi:hypothetical protein